MSLETVGKYMLREGALMQVKNQLEPHLARLSEGNVEMVVTRMEDRGKEGKLRVRALLVDGSGQVKDVEMALTGSHAQDFKDVVQAIATDRERLEEEAPNNGAIRISDALGVPVVHQEAGGRTINRLGTTVVSRER